MRSIDAAYVVTESRTIDGGSCDGILLLLIGSLSTIGVTLVTGIAVAEVVEDDDDDNRTNSLALLINVMTVSDETTVDASVTIASIRAVACFKIESAGVTVIFAVDDMVVERLLSIVSEAMEVFDVRMAGLSTFPVSTSFVVVDCINKGTIDSILNTCDNGLRKYDVIVLAAVSDGADKFPNDNSDVVLIVDCSNSVPTSFHTLLLLLLGMLALDVLSYILDGSVSWLPVPCDCDDDDDGDSIFNSGHCFRLDTIQALKSLSSSFSDISWICI